MPVNILGSQMAYNIKIGRYVTIVCPDTLDIQGVTGGTDQTSGECSLGKTIPI